MKKIKSILVLLFLTAHIIFTGIYTQIDNTEPDYQTYSCPVIDGTTGD